MKGSPETQISMNGIYAEKTKLSGQDYWIIKDVKTGSVVAIGDTITSAMQSYEVMLKKSELSKELGVIDVSW